MKNSTNKRIEALKAAKALLLESWDILISEELEVKYFEALHCVNYLIEGEY